jgi:hypothetical protein
MRRDALEDKSMYERRTRRSGNLARAEITWAIM